MTYAQRWQLAVALKQAEPSITETGAALTGEKWARWARIGGIVAAGVLVGYAVRGGKGAAIGAGVAIVGTVAVIAGGSLLV